MTSPSRLSINADGYRLQDCGGHTWIFRSPNGSYVVDLEIEPKCSCPSSERPYCKHIRFLVELYKVLVMDKPSTFEHMATTLSHYEE